MTSIKTLLQNIQEAKACNEYVKGENLCNAALQLDSSNCDLYVQRSSFRNAQNNFEGAIEDAKMSLKINPTCIKV